MKVEVKLNPEGKGEDAVVKIKAIVEDRSKVIAKRFGIDPSDIVVNLYQNGGALKSKLGPNTEGLGIYSGYVDHVNEIHLIHPEAVGPVFGENLDKEMIVNIDYALTKFYLCKKYYFDPSKYKIFHGYLSEALAGISSGKVRKEMLKFDFKTYTPEKRYKKDHELSMIFFVLMEMGGLDSIYKNLDKIVSDCDIKKSLHEIYKKSIAEIIDPYKKEAEEEHRKLLQRFKPGRRR